MNWRISHRPIFEIPGRKAFPTLSDHLNLAFGILLFAWVLHDYMRTNHITGQWGMAALFLARDALRAIVHPGG